MPSATVLIVDDEENVRAALRRTLRKTSHRLLFAENATAALDALGRHPVDIVLSDHLMPGMTGIELLRRARHEAPYAARVMLTGHADVDVAMEAVRNGDIDRFLTKPWDDLELRATLDMISDKLAVQAESRRLLAALQQTDGGPREGGGEAR